MLKAKKKNIIIKFLGSSKMINDITWPEKSEHINHLGLTGNLITLSIYLTNPFAPLHSTCFELGSNQ